MFRMVCFSENSELKYNLHSGDTESRSALSYMLYLVIELQILERIQNVCECFCAHKVSSPTDYIVRTDPDIDRDAEVLNSVEKPLWVHGPWIHWGPAWNSKSGRDDLEVPPQNLSLQYSIISQGLHSLILPSFMVFFSLTLHYSQNHILLNHI